MAKRIDVERALHRAARLLLRGHPRDAVRAEHIIDTASSLAAAQGWDDLCIEASEIKVWAEHGMTPLAVPWRMLRAMLHGLADSAALAALRRREARLAAPVAAMARGRAEGALLALQEHVAARASLEAAMGVRQTAQHEGELAARLWLMRERAQYERENADDAAHLAALWTGRAAGEAFKAAEVVYDATRGRQRYAVPPDRREPVNAWQRFAAERGGLW